MKSVGKTVKKGSARSKSPASNPTLTELTKIFGLLSDPSRLTILVTLARTEEMNVTSLCDLLGQSQPAVSHHLTLLKDKNLVAFRREGKFNYYRLDSTAVGNLLDRIFADAGDGQNRLAVGDVTLSYKRK